MTTDEIKIPEAGLTGAKKLEAVTELMNLLTADAKDVIFLPEDRNEALDRLKVYGRDPTNADPIFTPEGMETLMKHAFCSPSSKTGRYALRVLCNAMLLRAETRGIFVDLGYIPNVFRILRREDWEDEFLASRVLFLSTYDGQIDLQALIDKHSLAEITCHNLARHVKCMHDGQGKKSKLTEDPMEEMALVETCKLIFIVTFKISKDSPEKVSPFTPAIEHLVSLLWRRDIPRSQPLRPPFGSVVNTLLNLDFASEKARMDLFFRKDTNMVVARLIEMLGIALEAYGKADDELESSVAPLVNVLRRMHEVAPDPAKQYIRKALLPTDDDRQTVLGKSEAMTSRLLNHSTNPMTPNLRESISQFLFDMSDQDSQKFVDNVGYGFASGLLFNKNLQIPQSAAEAFSTGVQGGGGAAESARSTNPVTGQFLDMETGIAISEMTEEEKLREAERLFVLFEKLKQNGLISVENPIRTAVEEGRFEELPDDADLD